MTQTSFKEGMYPIDSVNNKSDCCNSQSKLELKMCITWGIKANYVSNTSVIALMTYIIGLWNLIGR